MGGDISSGKSRKVFYRGATCAFTLAVCLSVLPVLAAQNPPGQVYGTVQQGDDESAQAGASQGVPPSYPQVPPTITLPAGTAIIVRVSQMLSSDQNRPGDLFSTELQQPLVADGWVVARRGQTVLGRVAVAEKAGRVKGVSQLGVELNQLVLVDGQQFPIRTQLLRASAGTSQGRDAEAIATSGAIGAAIGAAARGGEGAAIGAAAGAGAGLAGVLLTRGRPTVIPPEALLTLQLQYPISIYTQRSPWAFRPVTQEDYTAGTLRRRPQRIAVAPYPPPPPYYYHYYYGPPVYGYYYAPYAYGYYPPPVFFGFYRAYGFGPRVWRRGFRH